MQNEQLYCFDDPNGWKIKNFLTVISVTRSLHIMIGNYPMKEFTKVKDHLPVVFVTKILLGVITKKFMKGFTLKKSLTLVIFVT